MQPTFFINHSGGPCFFLEPGLVRETWRELETCLQGSADTLIGRPRAILVISGHWEEAVPTVNTGACPPLLFDYDGFFGSRAADPDAEAFDNWLRQAMVDPATRDDALIGWESAPGARDAQPHEDHLLPLMVAAGAASGEPEGTVHFHGHALGKPISDFRFG